MNARHIEFYSPKQTHVAAGTSSLTVCSTNPPFPTSSRQAMTSLEYWFATTKYRPTGESAKCLGPPPPQGYQAASPSLPVFRSTGKTAMLSCPRLDRYRNRPSRESWICADQPVPSKPAGRAHVSSAGSWV